MSSELERYKRALEGARHALGMVERNPQALRDPNYIGAVQREIDDILHPPTEWEDVAEPRFVCPSCGAIYRHAANELCVCYKTGEPLEPKTLVEATLTFRRAKAQPVERSVRISINHSCGIGYPDADRAKNNVEGKTGVFTWTEQPTSTPKGGN